MKKDFWKSWGPFLLVFLLLGTSGSEARAFQISGGPGMLTLVLRLPANYEFIQKAPFEITFAPAVPGTISFPSIPAGHFDPRSPYTKIPFTAHAGAATVTIKATLFYCNQVTKMCLQNTHETRLTFEVASGGASSLFFIWNITPQTDPEQEKT